MPDFYATSDIFFEYLFYNALYVCLAVFFGIVLYRFREASFPQIPVKFIHDIGGDRFAEKSFHSEVFVKGKREHFKFKVTSGKFCDKLAAEEIRVGSGYENGMSPFLTKGIDNFFETFYVLDFIDKKICDSGSWNVIVDELFKKVGRLNGSVGSTIKVNINDMRIVDAFFTKLLRYCKHQTGFSATANARQYLDDVGVVVKTSDFFQVCFSFIKIHGEIISNLR